MYILLEYLETAIWRTNKTSRQNSSIKFEFVILVIKKIYLIIGIAKFYTRTSNIIIEVCVKCNSCFPQSFFLHPHARTLFLRVEDKLTVLVFCIKIVLQIH